MFKKIGVWVINFILGIIVTSYIIGKLGGGSEAVSTSQGVSINLSGMGFVIWIVVVIAYFYGAKKLWGKTVGGLIMDKLMPNA